MVDNANVIYINKLEADFELPSNVYSYNCTNGYELGDDSKHEVYECLQNGTWNNTAKTECVKGKVFYSLH